MPLFKNKFARVWSGPLHQYRKKGKVKIGVTVGVSIREDKLPEGESVDRIQKSLVAAVTKRLKAHE